MVWEVTPCVESDYHGTKEFDLRLGDYCDLQMSWYLYIPRYMPYFLVEGAQVRRSLKPR